MDLIWAVISSVALAVWVARSLTSEATTAKPRPASPARAASIVALRASRFDVVNEVDDLADLVGGVREGLHPAVRHIDFLGGSGGKRGGFGHALGAFADGAGHLLGGACNRFDIAGGFAGGIRRAFHLLERGCRILVHVPGNIAHGGDVLGNGFHDLPDFFLERFGKSPVGVFLGLPVALLGGAPFFIRLALSVAELGTGSVERAFGLTEGGNELLAAIVKNGRFQHHDACVNGKADIGRVPGPKSKRQGGVQNDVVSENGSSGGQHGAPVQQHDQHGKADHEIKMHVRLIAVPGKFVDIKTDHHHEGDGAALPGERAFRHQPPKRGGEPRQNDRQCCSTHIIPVVDRTQDRNDGDVQPEISDKPGHGPALHVDGIHLKAPLGKGRQGRHGAFARGETGAGSARGEGKPQGGAVRQHAAAGRQAGNDDVTGNAGAENVAARVT